MDDISGFCNSSFNIIPSIHALVCLVCQSVVPRDILIRHLADRKHRLSRPFALKVTKELDFRYPRLVSITDTLFQKTYEHPQDSGPLPHLPLLLNYYGCTETIPTINNEHNRCSFVASSHAEISAHYHKEHGRRVGRGRRQKNAPDDVPWVAGITCQRLRQVAPGKKPFQVYAAVTNSAIHGCDTEQIHVIPPKDTQQYINEQLAAIETRQTTLNPPSLAIDGGSKRSATFTRSPWLELTQWPVYFTNIRLADVTPLIELPPIDPSTSDSEEEIAENDILNQIITAFDGLIEEARATLTNGAMNIFDQCRVSSFQRGQPYHRPIFTKLLDGTYKRYKTVWKQLLCYAIRVVYFKHGPSLHYRVTKPQVEALDKLIAACQVSQKEQLPSANDTCLPQSHRVLSSEGAFIAQAQAQSRRCCLDFCISLLDHKLCANVYDSLVVSFLAALGIHKKNDCFQEPNNYTSGLSGLIKMAQFLVAQRAVVGTTEGEADFPSELLDDMQDRFMVHGSRSPIELALKFRRYGRSIRDTSTAHGFITWSDDSKTIGFKGIKLHLPDLRWFIRDRVGSTQELLEGILLIPPGYDGDRADVVPPLDIRRLHENTAIDTPGWSFLDDPRNEELQEKDKWLLDRVCTETSLNKRFMKSSNRGPPTWRVPAVKAYLSHVAEFLSHLLLLIHITSGQPARGTELLTVQWRNSREGLRRTVYLENGLVSIITSSIKGYSMEESTRIIHRYLPPEVGELLIYYLWLVVPFCRQLRLLATPKGREPIVEPRLPPLESSLLWGTSVGKPWTTDRLTEVMGQEFGTGMYCSMNVSSWRHIAIAISRKHMSEKGFKRDYDDHTQRKADHQAGHSSLIAGNVYGRLISLAPGYVQSAQVAYRDVSRKWHRCIGFGVLLPNRLAQRPATVPIPKMKRKASLELVRGTDKQQRAV
jgi:hypothetical protein